MKFVDDKNKKLRWYNRNFFWVVTIVYIALNILLYKYIGYNKLRYLENEHWIVFGPVKDWLIAIGNTYSHSSWEHVLHNMLAISFCLFYMERKMGSINLTLVLLSLTVIVAPICCVGAFFSWKGNSGIWFAAFGYVLVDYLFSLRKSERNLTNIIIGAVVLILEWFRTGFYDKRDGGIGWVLAPYQILQNWAHEIGFYIGALLALIICTVKIQNQKKEEVCYVETRSQKYQKTCSIFSKIMVALTVIAIAWVPAYVCVQTQREYVVMFEINANINDYNTSFTINDMSVESASTEDVVNYWLEKYSLPYTCQELTIEIKDIVNNEPCSSFYASGLGDPSYWDPWGIKDYIGQHYVITITLP